MPKTVQDIKMDLLTYASEYHLDPTVFVRALAEVVATMAHVDARHGSIDLGSRLKAFDDHVVASYERMARERISSRGLLSMLG